MTRTSSSRLSASPASLSAHAPTRARARIPTGTRRLLPAILGLALLFAGCATKIDVENAVRDSNYAMLADGAGSPTASLQADPSSGKPAVAASIAQLEAFIEKHPENLTTVNALRLRRALLHLNNRSFALADAAFKEIDAGKLQTVRDQTLYALRDRLLWWYEYSRLNVSGEFFADHQERATAAMRDLLARSDQLSAVPDLRDFLLETRAWIAIKLAFDTANADASRAGLEDAVNPWAKTFSPAELAQLAKLNAGAQPFDLSTRRILRARGVLDHIAAKTSSRPVDQRPRFENAAFQSYYANPPSP